MTTRKYSSRSQQTSLTGALTSSGTTATVVSGSALLGGITIAAGETFTVVIDPDTALEEIVDIYSASGNPVSTNTLTIVRGVENAGTGVAHSAGAIVRHMLTGRDLRESNAHIEDTTTAHGLTLSNVTLSSGTGNVSTAMLASNAVTTAKITDANVTAAKLASDSVTTAKILDSNVTTAKIADSAITSAKIADGTIVAGDIADGAITSAKILDGTIATADIADSAVTSAKIADGTIVNADINASAAIPYSKLNFVTGGPSIFDGTIVDNDVAASAAIAYSKLYLRNAIGGAGAVVSADIAPGTIVSSNIADGTIVAGDLADGAVTSAKILDGTIVNADVNTSAQIAYSKTNLTNSIVDADINASAAITKTKISGTAITAADTGTITSTMIADGAIVNADINAAAAIDKTKISGTAVTVADTGTVTSTMILDGTIVDADIDAAAAIAWTKIAPSSTVSSTELGYLDGVTSAVQTQLDAKLASATAATTYAPLASPALTGTPTAPTATAGTNTTQVATTAFVGTAVSNLVAAAPAALDTLNELATALGNDAAFSTTVTNNLATKLPLAGGTMSGAIAMGTNKITGVGDPTSAQDVSTKAYSDLKLPLTGGTLSGALAMGTNKITGLGTPTVSTDASTKAYADTMLPLAGGTMSGAIAMGTNKITGVGDPTVAQDAATKNYVDTAAIAPSNLTGPITSVGPATSIASQTGTGTKFVMDTSPTLVTPNIGVATATSVNGTTIPTSKTLVATDSTQYVVPSQTGNTGKYLTTDGTTSSWGTVAGYSAPTLGSTSIASGATVTTIAGLTLTSPTLTTPALGTPASGTLTNATGLPLTTGTTGTLPETKGGTNATTYTTGDVLYASATNTLAKRAIGSTGDVLTVAGGVPTWSAPAGGGGMTLIASGNITAAWLDITSIPSTYVDLILEIEGFRNTHGYASNLTMRLNSYSAPTAVPPAYSATRTLPSTSTSIVQNNDDQQYSFILGEIGANSTTFARIHIPQYTRVAGKSKNIFWDGYFGSYRRTHGFAKTTGAGLTNIGAITSIQLEGDKGTYGTYKLYGVK
jgi:hypothetical protein